MHENIVELQNIYKSYDGHSILDNISLSIKSGEFLTLLGPSGCGKTTLLRLISGFETPDSGKILIHGKEVSELTPQERRVNTVFQSYALFPHLNVFDNVAFGLRCKGGFSKQEIQQQVEEALKMVHLENFALRKPQQLSGGQQQRVAIARAIVNKPLVLLLDEPLSALDYRLRKNMQIELKQIQRQLGITFIFVTHDQEEALSMSDRVVVMHNGTIEQIGTPRDVYEEPTNLRVAKFIGEVNVFETELKHIDDKSIQVQLEDRLFTLKNRRNYDGSQPICVLIRPEDLRVWALNEVEDTSNMLHGVVEQVVYKGTTVDLLIRLPSQKLVAATEFFNEDDEKLDFYNDEKVYLDWLPGWEVILPHEA